MPEQTMQEAAKELHSAVIALKELIEREYPSRREVERRFQGKAKSAQRWHLVLVLILVSALLSFATTVTTVSTCFLRPIEDTPSACGWLPGYDETQERNQRIIDQFSELQEITERNERRLDRLENGRR